uniref:WD repeat-containing protein 17-like n=1 Tax=Styela clava TaxID=7725 RepID=UPI001939BBF4|nr:WD repeat-containing protein 17-like [Styela clava]
MMRQIGLLPAGCQPWFSNMIVGTMSKFAYCSTMAVYIYETSSSSQEYKLTAINAEHTKTISSIAWNSRCPNLIATFGADLKIVIWDVSKQKVIAQLPNVKVVSYCIDWINGQPDPQTISYIGVGGQLESWNISTGKVSAVKNITCSGGGKVTMFRWHHTKQKTIAFGHHDGSISLIIQGKRRILKSADNDETEDPVVVLSWDPLSNDYLLVANKLTGIRLIDTNSGSVISNFFLPSRAVSTCCFSWINSAPGMFLTGDKETGTLRLWTVGQDQPLENFKVKGTGFNGIHVLDVTQDDKFYDENLQPNSMQRKSSQSQVSSHSVPPAHVVCTFRDGGVGLYDLQKRKWKFCKDQGHIETIFDCKFKPDDPRMLATASFDGTVKIWSVNDLSAVKTSVGNEGVIYSLSWAPDNLNCVVCGTRRHGAFVWDFTKGKVIKRFSEHGYAAVFCVAWNQRDSHRIASCSEDSYCIVRRLDGKNVQKYPHPDSVYGCDWNLFDKNILATGCEDGIVRIWNVSSDVTTTCTMELKGHTKKVFNIRWHPLVKDILCTGSDDCTIRVWNIANNRDSTCIGVLSGHTSKVRGLTWNHEIPHLLVSGSWDSTIRVWDVREDNQKCLEVVTDHGADVYGLASHVSAPFLIASTSRDSTVRLWTLSSSLTLLFAKIIVGHPLDDIRASATEGFGSQSGLKLAGSMSKQIVQELKKKQRKPILKHRWFSELFCAIPSLENLWDVACCSMGTKDGSLSTQYKTGILHTSHITKYKAAEAQEIELSTASHSSPGNRQQEAALEIASKIHLKLGNLQRHCELLKTLGRWETALSLAPGVSIEYWRILAKQYAKILKKSNDVEALSYQIATGDSQACIHDLILAGDYEDALVVVQSAIECRTPSYAPVPKSLQNGDTKSEETSDDTIDSDDLKRLRTSCIEKLSKKKYLNGDPCRAATYLVSNNDVVGAMNCLINANELLLALCVGQAFANKSTSSYLVEASILFSRKLEAEKHYFFAVEILKIPLSEGNVLHQMWSPIHASCARYDGDDAHRENLYTYAGLESPIIFQQKGKQFQEDGQKIESMYCFLLSSTPELGLKIGLELLCNELKSSSWTLSTPSVLSLEAVFSVSSKILLKPDECLSKNILLAMSAYMGALKAINSGYFSVVIPLFEHAIAMAERIELMPNSSNNTFPFNSQELRQDLAEWKQYVSSLNQKQVKKEGVERDQSVENILHRAEVETMVIDPANETIVAGSGLPSHSDVNISSLTNKRIRGPVFWLEDHKTVISLNEAIMWARVNQFSPTGSGERIIPF